MVASTGDFILFTDADIVFAPDALRRAVAWAIRDRLGHAVAVPHFVAPGLLERGFVSLFSMMFLLDLEVNALGRPGSAGHLGIGAFNLVRRDAYQAIGGHDRLRLEVVDDVKLGLILRRSGVRQGCADSGGLVRVRWQRGFVASMRGLLKNFFAASDYRWLGVLRTTFSSPSRPPSRRCVSRSGRAGCRRSGRACSRRPRSRSPWRCTGRPRAA